MTTTNQILIYTSPDNHAEVSVQFQGETLWLSLNQIVELFGSSKANVSEHLKHIFEDGELEELATVRNFRTVQKEGQREVSRDIEHYNLDAIISVGYRVNSKQGTAFRIWATTRLREYLVQGYTINQKRLDELGKTIKLLAATGKKIDENEAK